MKCRRTCSLTMRKESASVLVDRYVIQASAGDELVYGCSQITLILVLLDCIFNLFLKEGQGVAMELTSYMNGYEDQVDQH